MTKLTPKFMFVERGRYYYQRKVPLEFQSTVGCKKWRAPLRHARNLIAAWRNDFNHHRPHTSLAGLTAAEYANRSKEDQNLNRANLN